MRPGPDSEFEIFIRDTSWKVRFVSRKDMPRNVWGYCDKAKKLITVRKDLSPQNTLDTLIHECLHAQDSVLFEAEEFVSDLATELAEIILRCQKIWQSSGKFKKAKRAR